MYLNVNLIRESGRGQRKAGEGGLIGAPRDILCILAIGIKQCSLFSRTSRGSHKVCTTLLGFKNA